MTMTTIMTILTMMAMMTTTTMTTTMIMTTPELSHFFGLGAEAIVSNYTADFAGQLR